MMGRKRMISLMLVTMMMGVMAVGAGGYEAKAEEETTYEDDDVTTDSYSEGTSTSLTRGIYLKSGSSSISDAGNCKIAVNGKTIAQKIVDEVYVGIRVQRKEEGKWASYTCWSATEKNSAYVSSTKTFKVPGGYYYRVYSDHAANSDSSGSYTNGIWIE